MNKFLSSKWTKAGVFLLCLMPILVLVYFGFQQDLTGNPLQYITHYTGDWTLRFFMITLAVTPLRVLLNRPAITRFRRMLGLYTFFYGSLHLLTWLWFDRQFEMAGVWEDIAMRLYITVGMAAYLTMVPLAITSTAGWVRRLGFQRWQRLHRLIYAGAILGVIHFLWLVKSDIREPLLYAAILTVLLGFRVVTAIKSNRRRPAVAQQGRTA
ncbi:MAG: protein-methionine-sulfoxide reductase heme-binding subunit MsrQ [Acidobacteriota bacterium]